MHSPRARAKGSSLPFLAHLNFSSNTVVMGSGSAPGSDGVAARFGPTPWGESGGDPALLPRPHPITQPVPSPEPPPGSSVSLCPPLCSEKLPGPSAFQGRQRWCSNTTVMLFGVLGLAPALSPAGHRAADQWSLLHRVNGRGGDRVWGTRTQCRGYSASGRAFWHWGACKGICGGAVRAAGDS